MDLLILSFYRTLQIAENLTQKNYIELSVDRRNPRIEIINYNFYLGNFGMAGKLGMLIFYSTGFLLFNFAIS